MKIKKPRRKSTGLFSVFREVLAVDTDERFANHTGPQTTGADIQRPHSTVGFLMTHTLQIGIKTTFRLDVGMAHNIADLGLFTAKGAFFAHAVLRSNIFLQLILRQSHLVPRRCRILALKLSRRSFQK